MSYYNWINGEDFSIDCFFLMDRWMLVMILGKYENKDLEAFNENQKILATLLKENPKLVWYCTRRAPEIEKSLHRLLEVAIPNLSKEELREKEIKLMEALETDVIYTNPKMMESNCNYITEWKEKTLYELVDLTDKIVLDIGAGTGRLTFAAAKLAKRVYASEPVDMLREYMRDKIGEQRITNVKVLDGVVMNLPYEDSTFDVVMSGHVVGDFYNEEIAEMTRVTKNGGYLVICNGDDEFKRKSPDKELIERGFRSYLHVSSLGGNIYNYIKQVNK